MTSDTTKESTKKTKISKKVAVNHAFDGEVLAHTRLVDADMVKDLIEKFHADVNYQDQNGMTALHHAAAIGARPCIRVLVNSGQCDYLIKDNENRYAYELAIIWAKDYAVGRLLAKKQAQQAHEQGVPAYDKPKMKKKKSKK